MRQLPSSLVGALALALLSAMVAPTGSARAQATIDDCEKIQAADAYNQCLAKFGPTSKVKTVEPVKPGDIKDNSAEAAAGAGPAKGRTAAVRGIHGRGHGRVVAHRHGGKAAAKSTPKGATKHGGRKRMTFTVRRRHK